LNRSLHLIRGSLTMSLLLLDREFIAGACKLVV
jgi:hypothetical protein